MYQRNGKWYSDLFYEGKRYTKSWGAIAKSVAREREWKWKNQIASGEYESRKANIMFEKLVGQYLEYYKINRRARSYERAITSTNALLSVFKGKSLNEIHPFLIERYKKERLEKVKPATVNRELACLKNMFKKAREWGHAKENPVKDVKLLKEEKKDVTTLSLEKEVELLNELRTEHARAIVTTALNTGMRLKEILDLTKDNVDFRKGIIHVTHTKNWEIRDIPMNEKLTKVLKEVIDRDPKSSYVFTSPKTGKPYTSIKTTFEKAVKRIGLPGFRFHDLRHTWCSRMCELGVDEATIMEIGGWKTRSMINRYAHPSMEHKREVLERLNKVPLKVPLVAENEHPLKLTASLSSVKI
jgi:integrase